MARLSERYLSAIWELTEILQEETHMESALSQCLDILMKTIDCEDGFVWMLNRDLDRLSVVTCSSGHDVTGLTIAKDQGLVGHVLGTGVMMTSPGQFSKNSPLNETDELLGVKSRNQLVCPIKTPQGQPYGCIHLINKKDQACFTDEDVRLSENLSSLMALDLDEKDYPIPKFKERPILISLRDVIKEFPSGDQISRVLKGINLDIFEGEFLVVLGESGCGKSTMMNIIGGMDKMTEGTMILEGKDFSRPSDKELTDFRRDYIGFIFQSYNLMPNLSALENLQLIAEICKDPVSPLKALEMVGLLDRAGNFPSMLSGGQQQRVSIARVITKNPRLILADEPTAALDYDTSIEVLALMEDIVKNQGKTVVMITHNTEIAKMADRVVKLRGGLVSSIRINISPLHASELSW